MGSSDLNLSEMQRIQDVNDAYEQLLDGHAALLARAEAAEQAIRKHRDQRGDDRCWRDDENLYAVLPEGYTPPKRDTEVELALCREFIDSRHSPRTIYVSPQRRIEELEADLARVTAERDALAAEAKALKDTMADPDGYGAGPAAEAGKA